MNPLLKIPRQLLEAALTDLERPHSFAAERLGFFSFRQSNSSICPHLLCYDYHPIADECYVHDDTVGGRINSVAIQDAMNRGYALGLLTGWSGASRPSCRVDYRGSQMTMTPSNMVAALSGCKCKHYPLAQCGEPIFRPL